MSDTVEVVSIAVHSYLQRGWAAIPIPHGAKAPVLKNWPALRLMHADIPAYFSEGQNVGVLLGRASHGLIDVDLDSCEAIASASAFLPETEAIFGRPAKPRSHWLYVSDTVLDTKRFRDTDGVTLVELRGDGAQTVFPPSSHSGEMVRWFETGDPAPIDNSRLRQSVSRLAAAVLFARHWPKEGSRHDATLALAGGLSRCGWTSEDISRFVEAVATAAGDEEASKRARDATHTHSTFLAGKNVTGWPTLATLIEKPVVDLAIHWLGVRHGNVAAQSKDTGIDSMGPSQAQRLVTIAQVAELFHTPEGDAFAIIPVNGHAETWSLKSKAFKDWLIRAFYDQSGKPPGNQAFQDAMRVLESKARYDGASQPVFLRVAHHVEAIYLDLCNSAWEVIEITGDGWRILSNPPVRFRRSKGMLPLPTPVRGGAIDLLRPYVNASDDRTWKLLVGFVVGTYRPKGPYPILILEGEAGSAKSTVSRVLRTLVDPSNAPLRSLPREERDLMINAQNAWLLNFDNLSHLTTDQADALCRLATGGGLSTRELYTDSDEVIFDAQRPMILNGIDSLASRADVADRALVVSLRRIADEYRKPESDFWRSFDADRPRILGSLLDAASLAIRNLPNIELKSHPRMADFAVWVTAAEPALCWRHGSFLNTYQEQHRDAAASGLEADPVVVKLRELLEDEIEWSGTAKELLAELNQRADDAERRERGWPQSPHALAHRVRRAAPFLRAIGFDVILDRREPGTARRRLLSFRQLSSITGPIVPTGPGVSNSSIRNGTGEGRSQNSDSAAMSQPYALTQNKSDGRDIWDGEMPPLASDTGEGDESA